MLYPKLSKKGVLLNGITPNPLTSDFEQVDPAAFSADQKDVLNIEHSETFALSCLSKGPGSYSYKPLIDGLPITTANRVTSDNGGSVIGDTGTVAYDGLQDTTLVLGNTDSKLIAAPVVFSISKFLNVLGKPNSFVLSASKSRGLYLFSLDVDKSITLCGFGNNAWSPIGNFPTPLGRDFLETDVVGFKVSNDKIQLMFNEEAVWEKNRTWNVTLSSPDLGTLSKEGPYKFGDVVDLTIGTKPGMYTMGFTNQEGVQFVLTQGISVTEQTAVTPVVTTPIETLIPVAAAVVATNNKPTGTAITALVGGDGSTSAEKSDWGKIATWSAVGLGIVAVVVLVVLSLRK